MTEELTLNDCLELHNLLKIDVVFKAAKPKIKQCISIKAIRKAWELGFFFVFDGGNLIDVKRDRDKEARYKKQVEAAMEKVMQPFVELAKAFSMSAMSAKEMARALKKNSQEIYENHRILSFGEPKMIHKCLYGKTKRIRKKYRKRILQELDSRGRNNC